MKKLIALILSVAVLAGLSACTKKPKPGEFEQSPITIAQNEKISSFGKSVENEAVVGYQNENKYIKYIVLNYFGGQKSGEAIHYFYLNEEAYEKFCEEHKDDAGVTIEKDKLYISFIIDDINTGNYKSDLELVQKDYTIK